MLAVAFKGYWSKQTVGYRSEECYAVVAKGGIETKRRQVLEWLSQVDCDAHHEKARDLRFNGTGEWLFGKPAFETWFEAECSSVMWLYGRGTIIATHNSRRKSLLWTDIAGSWVGKDCTKVGPCSCTNC